MNGTFRNIVYCSDVSGTGFWRHIQQIMSENCIQQATGVQNTYTQMPILDPRYYQGMASVTVQRWISDQQRDIFDRLLRPATDKGGSWLIYAIDDAMHYDDIPLFNRGRRAFVSDKVQDNIRHMLNSADLVVVTTEYIKKYYSTKYGVPIQNIVAAPNLLPRWWFGDRYDYKRKIEQFIRFKSRPRIGVVSSLSHYNIDNVRVSRDGMACRAGKDPKTGDEVWTKQDGTPVDFSETEPITDDLDQILDAIRSTIGEFQWVFFGYAPPKLKDLIDAKKIEYRPGVPILNYPSVIENLGLQAIVAPIKDMEFNRCKSHIKYLECCAAGVPLFASNLIPYSNTMKRDFLFDDQDELKDKLRALKFSSSGKYGKMVEDNWKWFNSPRRDGDFNIRNGWLEDNMGIWTDMFRLRPRARTYSMNLYLEHKAKEEAEREKNMIFKGENGVEILK